MTELWVSLEDLVPDRCNYKDDVFRSDVEDFMRRMMPGGPMGLLDTDGEDSFERWEIQSKGRYVVEEYARPDEDGWVVRDTDGDDYLDGRGATSYAREDGEEIPVYDDERDAQSAADEANQEHDNESRYGFPWANSWWYRPDEVITDEDLKAAGFVVAQYLGGGGRWREDEWFRLAGIDGGGYSFSGAHFAALYAIVSERLEWKVATANGPAYITVAKKDPLQILAEGRGDG